jgi:hydroxymethylbilane synthase
LRHRQSNARYRRQRLFTKELELALLAGSIDFAVHSLKDVPVTMPLVDTTNLVIAAVPERADPRDVLVSSLASTVDDLPARGLVGTGSLRRRCQILNRRPDLEVQVVRGNVDTRLKLIQQGRFDAIILAGAGVRRSGLYDSAIMSPIGTDIILPAAGQGALALQCRRSDSATRQILEKMNDQLTAICVDAERSVIAGLNGDCRSPIAVLAEVSGANFFLRALVGDCNGKSVVSAATTVPVEHASIAANTVVAELSRRGAGKLLARAPSAGSIVEVG